MERKNPESWKRIAIERKQANTKSHEKKVGHGLFDEEDFSLLGIDARPLRMTNCLVTGRIFTHFSDALPDG